MPTLEVTIDRIKMLLKQNHYDPEEVPLPILKQAIMRTATATELQNINRKIKMLHECGAIKEIREGVCRIR